MKLAAEFDLATIGGAEDAMPRIDRSKAPPDLAAARGAVRDLLLALGFDPCEEGLADTPRRVAATLAALVTPQPFTMTTFANTEGYEDLVLARAIPFHSLCQHHLLPFIGVAQITAQIAKCLDRTLTPKGVGVILEAEHLCMSLRGVQKSGTKTMTSTLLGTLRHDPRAREEFLALAGVRESNLARRLAVLVSRRESFNAAHQLYDPALSDEQNRDVFGKCMNLHGHNYMLDVAVAGEIDPETGYVMDLKRLSDLVCKEIIQHVDHRNLNTDVPWLAGRIPTAENLAVAFWDRLEPQMPAGTLRAVRVWETDKNWAEYRGGE